MGEGEIDYREKSPELYEESPKKPGQEDGETEEGWHPDPEFADSPYYRKLHEEEFAKLEQKEGGGQGGYPFDETDPKTPVEIKHKLNDSVMLRLNGCRRPRGYRDELMFNKSQLAFAIIEGDLSGDDSFFDKSNFRNARVTANFEKANLREADFSGAELECDFSGADLAGVSFKGCDLRKCSFKNANLRMADLRGATLPEPEALEGASLINVRM